MKRFKEIFSFGKIRNKFLYCMLAIGIIPLLLVGSVSFLIATKNVKDSSVQLFSTNLDISNRVVDLLSKNIEALSRSVLANRDIKKHMEEFDVQSNPYLNGKTIQELDSIFANLALDSNQFSGIFLFSKSGFKYQYTPFAYSAIDLWKVDFEKIEEQDWYDRTLKADGKECYLLYNVLERYSIRQNNPFSISTTKLLRDTRTGEVYGVLVINTPISYYSSVYPAEIQSDDSQYFLADSAGQSAEYLDLQVENAQQAKEAQTYYSKVLKSGKYVVSSVRCQRTGWELLHVIENSKLALDGFSIPVMTVSVVLILIILSVIFSIFSANTINRPLDKLSKLIEEGKDPQKIESVQFGEDEIGKIGIKYQMMLKQNEQLNQKIVNLSILEKEAELNALQAQINPHFFYNTLATMYWLAKFGKNADVAEMAISLSDIFKIALKRGSDMITVEAEMEYITKYINIQNIRYQNRIQFRLEVDPEMLQKKILKLILQPLVENAIYHGLETKIGDWKLSVTGKLTDGTMKFTVEDNGVGMEVDSIPQGMGVQNVAERIRLKYGEAYGCHIESEPEKGTRVTITVPEQGE